MTYLLDTCILSKLRKIKVQPNPKLESWIARHPESSYFISVLTIGEILKGIAKLKEEKTKKNLIDWFEEELIPRFGNRVLSVDVETASIWGHLCGDSQKNGWNFPVIDSLLAASAIQHDLILVTENIKDFSSMHIQLYNPFD